MKYGNVTGKIFADAFAVCRARMRKTAKKLPAPSRMYRGGRESRAGQPTKVAAVRGNPPKPAAVRVAPPKPAAGRGSPAKVRRRAGKPRQSAPLRRTGRNIKKAAGRMTRRLRGLYSSACSKLTFLLLWLYNTVRMCRFCDETETLRLQLRTGLVKLLRCCFYLL